MKGQAKSLQTFVQPRRFPRYRYDARVKVGLFRNGENSSFWGRSSELGMDGASATLTGELCLGEVVLVEFPVPLPPHVMRVRAIVRYSEGLRCGFEFLVVTTEQRDALTRLFETLAESA